MRKIREGTHAHGVIEFAVNLLFRPQGLQLVKLKGEVDALCWGFCVGGWC